VRAAVVAAQAAYQRIYGGDPIVQPRVAGLADGIISNGSSSSTRTSRSSRATRAATSAEFNAAEDVVRHALAVVNPHKKKPCPKRSVKITHL
jgi:hypothetical protein